MTHKAVDLNSKRGRLNAKHVTRSIRGVRPDEILRDVNALYNKCDTRYFDDEQFILRLTKVTLYATQISYVTDDR